MEISFIPRWLIKYFSKDYFRQNDLNILISNVFIICVFILFKNTLIYFLNLIPHFCLIDKIFGIECPVCGTLRAFCELSKGNIIKAYYFNFSSLFVASFFIFQIPLRLYSLIKQDVTKKVNLVSKNIGNILFLIILSAWVIQLFYKK